MFKADTSTIGECFTAGPGRDVGLRAVERRAGTARSTAGRYRRRLYGPDG